MPGPSSAWAVGDEGSALIGDGEKSTKHKAADKLVAKGSKVKIISEAAFIKMLDGK